MLASRKTRRSLVSIHAPAWGATKTRSSYNRGPFGFNPRARVGRDLRPEDVDVDDPRVSIHAPAWGATFPPYATKCPTFGFNPRARVGRDLRFLSNCQVRPKFQSTRPRGARLPWVKNAMQSQTVSIHAPAWGATQARQGAVRQGGRVSIHAPAWGATDDVRDLTRRGGFQSTRPRGARPRRASRATRVRACFNPRARVGRDCQITSLFYT